MDSATGSASGSLEAGASDDFQHASAESRKRPRKMFEEIAAIRAADLETLKPKDISGWTEKRKANQVGRESE
jgi:hypothetical protein